MRKTGNEIEIYEERDRQTEIEREREDKETEREEESSGLSVHVVCLEGCFSSGRGFGTIHALSHTLGANITFYLCITNKKNWSEK